MNLLADHSQHGRDTGPANVDIEDSHIVLLCKTQGQLSCDGAFADTAFSGQNKNFMFDVIEFLFYNGDGRVDFEFA
jgi:hypothetical protein